MRTLRFLLRKEFLQIFRDRFMLRLSILLPIVQLLILSSAATFEVKSAKVYVVDRDHSSMSRRLIDRLRASRRFIVADASPSMELANEAMLARRVSVIVGIPSDFERDLLRSHSAKVQLVFNAEDGATAGVTQSYAAQIIAAYARELGGEIMPLARAAPKIEVRARGWYNPELDYRDYMVPGILVQLVTVVGTLLTAMNIVREKELGTLDQLSVTPLSQGVFIAAKLIPLWLIALFELTLGLMVARFVFHVPMLGSIPLVFGAAALYLVAALGIGLFVSTLASTQQQAMFVTFFIVMIYLLMSGLFTPIRSMPEWAQWITQVNPVKHFIEIMRAVLLKGAGVGDVLKPLGALAVFGVVVLSLAVRQYGRRVG
ncbi:MAG: putative transport system, rane protein [Gemmatimonadetes bacterium]|nr:putative transport system, rane protein [Gemmatimonadota bacterium]